MTQKSAPVAQSLNNPFNNLPLPRRFLRIPILSQRHHLNRRNSKMADPSTAVNGLVHSHFFMTCNYALSKSPVLPITTVLDILVKGPQIAQQSPFTWTMLDAPDEGTMLLVMIPPQMQNVQTTDGCVWLEAEVPTRIDERGFVSLRSISPCCCCCCCFSCLFHYPSVVP